MAVAPNLAPPVAILLEKADWGADAARPRTASTLPAVIAWGKAGFPAEELREMAGIRVADFKSDSDDALFRFAQQLSRRIQPQIDVVARRGYAHGILEQAMKMKLAQPRLSRQLFKVEVFGGVPGYPSGYLSKLEARK